MILKGTTNPGQRQPGCNDNEGVSTLPKVPGLEPGHKKQFCILPKTLVGEVLPLCKGVDSVFYGYYLPTPPLGQDMTQGQF